jgi:Flp pilus assembly protein CpaB
MVGFSLLFAALALRADPATPVLMVARPVPAGATITDADLSVVRMVPEAGMGVFTEADWSSVVGRTAAVPLVAGSVLSPAQVGAPDWPPTGESVVAVVFSAGQVPAGVVAGSHVSILLPSVSDGDGAPAAAAVVSATVVEVALPDVSGSVVVSLLARAADARLVAAASGDVSLLLENPAGGR